ncbi:hypothetical protein Tco_1187617 [Tanacetum coccineum]
METKDTSSSCSDSDKQIMQQMLKRATILKEGSMNGLNALKKNFQLLSKTNLFGSPIECVFKREFERLFGEEHLTFTDSLLHNLNNLEKQLIKETLPEVDSKCALTALKTQCAIFFHSELLKLTDYDENQSNTSGNKSSRSRNECNDKGTFGDDTNIRPTYDTEPMAENDSNVIPDSSNMCDIDNKVDQNAEACDDERVALANLITNLKLDIDENKKIQKQLKKANTSLTQELKERKYTLEETNRTLGESNSTRDSCLIALQNKEIELEKYKTYLNHTTEYDTLERKLKDTQGLLAQKENDIKEGLKLKANEISVANKKHDELVK